MYEHIKKELELKTKLKLTGGKADKSQQVKNNCLFYAFLCFYANRIILWTRIEMPVWSLVPGT